MISFSLNIGECCVCTCWATETISLAGFLQTAACSMQAAFLSMGGRDRQKSRQRQAAPPGPKAAPVASWSGRRWWHPEQNLLRADANALPSWSVCVCAQRVLNGKVFISLFSGIKTQEGLFSYPETSSCRVHCCVRGNKTQQDNKDSICWREGSKEQVLSRG